MLKKLVGLGMLLAGLSCGAYAMGHHPAAASDDSEFDAKAVGQTPTTTPPLISDVNQQEQKGEPLPKTPDEVESDNSKALSSDPFFKMSDKEKETAKTHD